MAYNETRVDLRAAKYRIAEDMDASCATCEHYEPQWGGCDVVAGGTIRADFTCDLHEVGMRVAVEMSADLKITKSLDEKMQVFGWAYVSISKDGAEVEDHSGEMVDVETLESAAYTFALAYGDTGDMHQGEATGRMIESMVFTKSKLEALGLADDAVEQGWWVGFQLADREQFDKVKAGDRAMFSIQGTAMKETADA